MTRKLIRVWTDATWGQRVAWTLLVVWLVALVLVEWRLALIVLELRAL